jgi:NodT family efflux transporter outer membrane factor (OMF) lipoprotein
MVELTRQRHAAGLDTKTALREAEAELPQLRAQLEGLQGQVAIVCHQLGAWTAQPLDTALAVTPKLEPLRLPALPARLGLDLLGRRAEVVAARWRAEAAAETVSGARAAFMPDVNLLAFAGMSALGMQHLFDIGSRTAGVSAAFRLPIFEGGRLTAQLDERQAEHAAAVAAYDAAVLQAVREAADAVAQVQALARQQREQEQALAAVEEAARLASERSGAGLGGAMPMLMLQWQAQQQRRARVELQVRALDAQAQLMQALGGGYECAGCAQAARQ